MQLLADPRAERAACGTGFIAQLRGCPSHALLRDALATLTNLAHRGARAADGKSGDGAGILTQIPYTFFARGLAQQGLRAPAPADLAVGMFFLPPSESAACVQAKNVIAAALHAQGLHFLTWRVVPVDVDALGEHARSTRPHIEQALIARTASVGAGDAFERALCLARKEIEREAGAQALHIYVPSLSARTLVYKGLFVSPQLAPFYADLRDPLYKTAIALFHQRYSTNTFPSWERAQPFRYLCHNGEINTLQGNITWMRARAPHLASPLWGEKVKALIPVIDTSGSDSTMLDNALELLTLSGREVPHAMMMLIPEAWDQVSDIPECRRAFYRYHASLMEPWDGPAAIAFSNGQIAGMSLDRNGLRPARYLVTDDGLVLAASEAGALEVDPARVIEKGKLGPGQMVIADLTRGCVLHNDEIKDDYARRRPYAQWVMEGIRTLDDPFTGAGLDPARGRASAWSEDHLVSALNNGNSQADPPALSMLALQAAFGYTHEEIVVVLHPMAENGEEPIGSMGDDTPHAVLSQFDRPLYHFFKQRFAEVTNPPIDSLREQLVMSKRVLLGARGNVLDEAPGETRLLELASPFLSSAQIQELRSQHDEFACSERRPALGWASAEDARSRWHFACTVLAATFDAREGEAGLRSALPALCAHAERAVSAGAAILIISDRAVSETRAPIPMLLAVSAIHHHLLISGKRWQTSLVAESGDARDVHHFACLIGYGANALNPYLALATARALAHSAHGRAKALSPDKAEANFIQAAEKGLLKIMSKIGIATLDAYHGAQVFESVGLSDAVVGQFFTGTPSPIGGIGLEDIAGTTLAHHARAFRDGEQASLGHFGFFKFKKHGEYHAMNPELVGALHAAVRVPGALNGGFHIAFKKYREFAELVHKRPATDLADHLDIRPGSPIPIEEVEPARGILKCFSSAAMSHGALSLEAHTAIAIATHRIGALSNSGEGGEHPSRYGTESNSPIKQVASARFGVTPAYLMSADELQIKMAQGSKPGEGGQLPAHKVTAEIAAIRHTSPGIALISPPPHHDIYSIEDLAQLIYDLKRINPRAKISVKLVAQAGVGTIAAGVAKAHADIIHISGHSGGTGASPLSSIKHAGVAWELGLAETQQILVANDLRGRVRVRVDGGFKTARHVIIAAMLGADEFSFGTAAVVAGGCIMARACHLNTCPVGIATQRADLRAHFPDVPEWIMAYLLFVAEETRGYLAELGCRTLDELTGRVERLAYDRRPQAGRGTREFSLTPRPLSHWERGG